MNEVTFSGASGVPSLQAQLERLFDEPGLVDAYRERARERARRYSWDAVTDQYEQLLSDALAAGGPGALPAHLVDGDRPAAAAVSGASPTPIAR